MSGYTKADFYATYRSYASDKQTSRLFNNYRAPDLFNGAPITLLLHYHPAVICPGKQFSAARLVNKIQTNDVVAIVGGAFNWLGDALEDLIGCTTYSVDTSEWIHQDKSVSPDNDLISAIETQGYNINDGIGEYLFNIFSDPSPRSRNPERIVTNYESIPDTVTKIITEECWQILDQQTKDYYTSLTLPLIHIIDGEVI